MFDELSFQFANKYKIFQTDILTVRTDVAIVWTDAKYFCTDRQTIQMDTIFFGMDRQTVWTDAIFLKRIGNLFKRMINHFEQLF